MSARYRRPDPFNRLVRERVNRGLTREAVALGAGISLNTLRDLELDASRIPRASTAKALADFFGDSPTDWLDLRVPAEEAA